MNDLFRIVTVTRDGGRVSRAVALVTGPSLDLVRAVAPAAEYAGANPVTVTLPGPSVARLHQVASQVPEVDERYTAAVPVAAALADLADGGREEVPA